MIPATRSRRYVVIAAALTVLLAAAAVVTGFVEHDGDSGSPRASLTEWAAAPTTSSSGGTVSAPSAPPGPGADGGTRRARRAETVGVVRIVVSRGSAGATATGMVLTSTGRIVTNRHAVAGASRIQITVMATGQRYRARIVGTDRRHDVAVLHAVGASGLRRVRLDRTALRVGQHVTAVGDAGGSSTHLTAAPGRVRSLNRQFVAPATPGEPAETLDGVAEVTCDVSPGDSGGPTYDRAGAVVAMTTGEVLVGHEPEGVVIPIATVMHAVGRIVR